MTKKKRHPEDDSDRRKGDVHGSDGFLPDTGAVFDPPVLEGLLRQHIQEISGEDSADPTLRQAHALVEQAFQADDEGSRSELARRALEISPDCADAHTCLAELAPMAKEALTHWEQGVAAGARALGGEDALDSYSGRFWGVLDTRPYMRARLGLAQCLWSLRRRDEAVDHCRELLRLNPDDNQGVRYVLSCYLCELNRDDEWQQLVSLYPDDASAEWHFGRALLAYRRAGDTDESRALLGAAHAANPHVAGYLVGNEVLPDVPPRYVQLGEASEAHSYVGAFLPGWRGTPGAAAWVRKTLQIAPSGSERPQRRPSWNFLKGSVGDLPLSEGETWQVDVRQTGQRNPAADTPAVWTVAVVNAEQEQILLLQPWDAAERPKPREVLIEVLEAMRMPLDDQPRRPAVIQVLRKAYCKSWTPKLEELSVHCESIDRSEFLDALMERMEEMGAAVPLSEEERLQRAAGIADLPQVGGEVWQVASRKLAAWITGEGEPRRPWVTLVACPEAEAILGQSLGLEPPSDSQVWETILNAVISPAVGEPHLPAAIDFGSPAQCDAVRPQLEPLGVACTARRHLPEMDALLDSLSDSLNGGHQMAAMIDTPAVAPAQVGGLFAAAAEFYRQRPWRDAPSDAAIEIRCDKFQADRWHAVVMGQSGMTYGLALYEDRKVLEAILRQEPGADRRSSGLSIIYSEAFEISTRDLDAAEREGWPVAGPEAYPLVLRINPGMAVRPPLAWELELLEGCLRAIPKFLTRDAPTPARMTVPVTSGELTLQLQWTM